MPRRRYDRPLRILQVNTADVAGGAEKVSWDLLRAYRRLGHDAWLAVGSKFSDDSRVVIIPNEECRSKWVRMWRHAQAWSRGRGLQHPSRLASWLAWLGEPRRAFDTLRGAEDFHFPGTAHLLRCAADRPDIVHAHNLHGSYFDLRCIAGLSHELPVVLTLHDDWLLSGHCAYAFECERWKLGCGSCPNLTTYPSIRRDATAYNWRRKQAIFARSRFYLATPSRWLMQRVEESMLAPAVARRMVIPNGVDLSIFHPTPRQAARRSLGISEDAAVLLFVAHGIHSNPRKGYPLLREAVAAISDRLPRHKILLLAVGEKAPSEQIGGTEVRFISPQREAHAVAQFYQAADLYVHPAQADTFPTTVLEALACGVPVVATAVGGIPEQVKSTHVIGEIQGRASFAPEEATGVLTPPGDAEAMAKAITTLLAEDDLRRRLGRNAGQDAAQRFDVERQIESYLDWYLEILSSVTTHDSVEGSPSALSR